MVKPDIKDGHIDIAHDLANALMKINLSGYQYRIIWCIFRKTYGWHKSTDKISLTCFEKMTGLERRNINRSLKELEDMNMIIIDRNNYINTYKFNSDYDTWKFKDGIRLNTGVSLDTNTGVKLDTKAVSKSTPEIVLNKIPELVLKETHTKEIKETKETIQKKGKVSYYRAFGEEEEYLLQRTLKWCENWTWKIPLEYREGLIKHYIKKYGIDYYEKLFEREANKNEPNAIEFLTKVLPNPESFYNEGRQA
jgi:phage replication O-like protein O